MSSPSEILLYQISLPQLVSSLKSAPQSVDPLIVVVVEKVIAILTSGSLEGMLYT